MNKVEKLKVIYKEIDAKPCKITQLSNGNFEIKVDLKEQDQIDIYGRENIWRLSQYTNKEANEFYAIDYKKTDNEEKVAYANESIVGNYKNINQLNRFDNVIKKDVDFLKKLNNEIENYKENEFAKYKMCGE